MAGLPPSEKLRLLTFQKHPGRSGDLRIVLVYLFSGNAKLQIRKAQVFHHPKFAKPGHETPEEHPTLENKKKNKQRTKTKTTNKEQKRKEQTKTTKFNKQNKQRKPNLYKQRFKTTQNPKQNVSLLYVL